MSLLLLTVTPRGVSNKHCLLPLFSFLQKCLLSSPLRFIRLVQIGEFDLLSARLKGSIFVKMLKNLLRNHEGDEAKTWHTCLGH